MIATAQYSPAQTTPRDLQSLPTESQQSLYYMLIDDEPYLVAKAWLAEGFDIEVTTDELSSFYLWYGSNVRPSEIERQVKQPCSTLETVNQ